MDINKLHQILENHPSLKATESAHAEHWRVELQKAKEQYRQAEAGTYLQLKAKYPQDAIATLNAKVSNDMDLLQLRLNLIDIESQYKKCEIEIERLDDEFTGAKKDAEILRKEMTL